MLNTQSNLHSQSNRQNLIQAPSPAKKLDPRLVTSATLVFNPAAVPITILRLPQVLQKIGIGRSKLYLFLNPRSKYFDADFPRPINLGLRSIGWNLVEVENWLQKKLDGRPDIIYSKGMTLGDH